MVDYPKLISGDHVVEWLSVPKDWDRHRIDVIQVYDRVRKWLHSLPGVVGTGIVRSDRTYGGQNGFQIKITLAADAGQSMGEIPGEIDGIQTTAERSPDRWSLADCSINTGNCTNREQNDTVSGGDVVGWVDGGYGTATCRITVNGTQRLLHCGHVFWHNCADATSADISGRVAVAEDERLGTVESIDVQADYSIIDGQYGGEYAAVIDDNSTFPPLIGHVTEVACAYWSTLPRRDRPCLYNMGGTTGLTTGTITGTDISYTRPHCTTMKQAGIVTDCTAGEGDSGGPTFLLHKDDAYLVNITSYYYVGTETVCNGARVGIESAGLAAWWLATNTNITFDSASGTRR